MEDDESQYAVELLPKRKRDRNFSEEEQLLLAELVKPYLDVFENKSCNQSAIDLKERKWMEVAEQYNLNQPAFPREWRKLRDLYQRMKIKAKKEATVVRKRDETGTVAESKHRLPTQISESMMELTSQQELESVENAFDSSGSASNAQCKSGEQSVGASGSEGEGEGDGEGEGEGEGDATEAAALDNGAARPRQATYEIRIESVPATTSAAYWKDKRRSPLASASAAPRPPTSRPTRTPVVPLASGVTLKRGRSLSHLHSPASIYRKLALAKRPCDDVVSAQAATRLHAPEDRLPRLEIERHRKAMEVYEEQLLAARAQRLYYDYKLKLLRSNCAS